MTEHCNRGPYEDTFANRLAQVLRGDEGRGGSAVNFKHQRPHSGLCASRAYFISECSLSLIAAFESRDTHAHACFLGEACRGDYPRVSSAAAPAVPPAALPLYFATLRSRAASPPNLEITKENGLCQDCQCHFTKLQRKRRAAQNGRIRGRAHGPEPERRCASSVLCVSSPFACPVLGLCMKAAYTSLVSMC